MSDRNTVDQWYLNRYGREPLLTVREELILSRQIHEGRAPEATPNQRRIAERARQRMIRANQRLAVNVALKYMSRCRSLELADLAQEAMIGLSTAVEKFDYSKGYKFSTYAYWWVRQAITRAIVSRDTMIRVPQHAHDDLSRVRHLMQRHAAIGESLTLEQAAEISGVGIETLNLAIRAEGVASLNRMAHAESDCELIDLMPDPRSGGEPEDYPLLRGEISACITSWLEPTQAEVIAERFGFADGEPKTLAAIAANRGLSRERIRQIEAKALRRLRYCLSAHMESTAATK